MPEKYLAGHIDLGLLGKVEILIFRNKRREKKTQPAYRVFIKDGESLKEVGALWVREKEKEGEEFIE